MRNPQAIAARDFTCYTGWLPSAHLQQPSAGRLLAVEPSFGVPCARRLPSLLPSLDSLSICCAWLALSCSPAPEGLYHTSGMYNTSCSPAQATEQCAACPRAAPKCCSWCNLGRRGEWSFPRFLANIVHTREATGIAPGIWMIRLIPLDESHEHTMWLCAIVASLYGTMFKPAWACPVGQQGTL